MWRVVMRPSLLRPPVLVLPSTSILTGEPFHRLLRSTWTRWRRPGEVGRNVFNAMTVSSQARRHVDGVACLQRDDRLLGVGEQRAAALEHLVLALADERVDRLHF